jgi:serralysin
LDFACDNLVHPCNTLPGAVDPNAPPEEPVEGRSRLWQLDFDDMSDPSRGGTLTMLLDGTEEHQMLDNMTISQDGKILLQEDLGTTLYLAKVWEYNPNTDKLKLLAEHNPDLFGPDAGKNTFLTTNEESSGIIDVTDILGDVKKDVYLLDVQAHYDNDDRELDEGGQLLAMTVTNDAGVGVTGVPPVADAAWM